MHIKSITTILLSISALAIATLTFLAAVQKNWSFAGVDAGALILVIALLIAHIKGFKWAPQILVIGSAIIMLIGLPVDLDNRLPFYFNVLTPVVLAAVLLPWYWSLGIFALTYIGMAFVWQGQGEIFTPTVAVILCLQAGGIALASVVARTAQRRAEENALDLQKAFETAENQKLALAQQADELKLQNDEQSRLLELVTILEVPIVTIANQVLFAPVVGSLDSRRSQALTTRLLDRVNSERARLVILDIAGVTTMDTGMAKAIIDTAQAVRLLGCDIIISGIAASIATTITHLKIDLGNVRTARSPQEALEMYKNQLENTPLRQLAVNGTSEKKPENTISSLSYELS